MSLVYCGRAVWCVVVSCSNVKWCGVGGLVLVWCGSEW